MTNQPHPTHQRRDILAATPAPLPHHDIIVILEDNCIGDRLRLRYVPDRDVLDPASLNAYLGALGKLAFSSLEETAQMILEDINDRIIPRWLEVTLSRRSEQTHHQIRIEDRQPHWKDRGLLDRLEP